MKEMQKGIVHLGVMIVAIVLIIFGVIIAFTAIQKEEMQSNTEGAPVEKPAETVMVSPLPELDDWKTYDAQDLGIRLHYPKDARPDQFDTPYGQGFSITYVGKDQPGDTEVIDGYRLSFMAGLRDSRTVNQIASEMREANLSDPSFRDIGELEMVNFGDLTGFQYQSSSLGTSTEILVGLDGERYLQITKIVEGERRSEYEEEINKILLSIRS